jgi:hypothetical protein
LCFGFRLTQKVLANFFRDVRRDGTGVRLLFRDAVAGQKVNDRFGLNLELAGQLINSDLVGVAQDFASSA